MLNKLALVGAVSVSLVGCGGSDSKQSSDSNESSHTETTHTETTKTSLGNIFAGKHITLTIGRSGDGRASLSYIGSGIINIGNDTLRFLDVSEAERTEMVSAGLKDGALLYRIGGKSETFALFDKVELNIQLNLKQVPEGVLKIRQVHVQEGNLDYTEIDNAENPEYKKEAKEDGEYSTVELTAKVPGPGYYTVEFADPGILLPSQKNSSAGAAEKSGVTDSSDSSAGKAEETVTADSDTAETLVDSRRSKKL